MFTADNIAKFKDCGVFMLDSPTDILPIVLNYLGKEPMSKDKADLAAAEEVMMAIRPSVRKFHSSEYINALANGDICMAIGCRVTSSRRAAAPRKPMPGEGGHTPCPPKAPRCGST